MLPADVAHRVHRRFLHAPSNCRAGCEACLGALLSQRGRSTRRRLLIGAGTVLLLGAGVLGLPPARDGATWRDHAAALVDELSAPGYAGDPAATRLRTDLALLGYAAQPPPDEDDGAAVDDEDTDDTSEDGAELDSDEAPPTDDGPEDEEPSSAPGTGGADGGGTGGGAGGDVLWAADGSDLSEFEGGGDSQQDGSPPPDVVEDPVRSGERAISFTIPGGGQRNEVLPGLDFGEGDERWFGFSTLLEDGFPTDAGWSLITQWKNDGTGSPPLELSVQGGQYRLSGGFGHPDGEQEWNEPLGEPVTGQWASWVIHVVFSDGPDALAEVWLDGEPVLTGFSPEAGTLYPGLDSYLKIGYYRDTGIGEDGTVLHANWVVGTSRAAVDPMAGDDGDPSDAAPTSADGDAEDWESLADELAEQLVDVDDPAGRELAEALADAGFDPALGSTDAPATTDAAPTSDEAEPSARRGGAG